MIWLIFENFAAFSENVDFLDTYIATTYFKILIKLVSDIKFVFRKR